MGEGRGRGGGGGAGADFIQNRLFKQGKQINVQLSCHRYI